MAQVTSGEIVHADWLQILPVVRMGFFRKFFSSKIFETSFEVSNLAISIAVVLIYMSKLLIVDTGLICFGVFCSKACNSRICFNAHETIACHSQCCNTG